MNIKKNSFSIILPMYNSENTIEETIDSVLNQSYENYELIIVDDGSTDNSKIAVSKYLKNEHIKYIFQTNGGVSLARNKGISCSKNDYIIFIDSDDVLESEALSICNDKINKFDSDIYSFGYASFNDTFFKEYYCQFFKTTNLNDYLEKLLPNYLLNQLWNKVYKRKIIKNNNIYFDNEISIAEDLKFNVKYFKNVRTFANFPDIIYGYRLSNTGLGFRFRLDSGIIKLDIDLELKEMLLKEKQTTVLVDKLIIKDLFSYYSKIVDNRNKMKVKTKRKLIMDIQKKYYEEIIKLNVKKIPYKFLRLILKFNNITTIYSHYLQIKLIQ